MWFLNKNRQKKIIFIHIHKTGGTTFRHILENIFPGSFHYCLDPRLGNIKKRLKRYDCIEFHADMVNGDLVYMTRDILKPENRYLLKDTEIFVMFRNPLRHYLSCFNYTLKKKNDLLETYRKRNHPFPKTLEDYMRISSFNQQTASLIGNIPLPGETGATQKDLDYAKALLVELNMKIGIMERYEDFLHIFETFSGLILPNRTIEIKNRHRKKVPYDAVSENVKAIILERNNLDKTLYKFATKIFEKQLAECGSRPEYLFI